MSFSKRSRKYFLPTSHNRPYSYFFWYIVLDLACNGGSCGDLYFGKKYLYVKRFSPRVQAGLSSMSKPIQSIQIVDCVGKL